MKARLLSTVAASLLVGIGAAYAQSPQPAPERAPAAQQSAPAEKVAPSMKEKATPSTTGQASPDSKMDRPASGSMNKSPENSGQAPKAGEDKSGAGMKGSSEMKEKSGSTKSSSEMKGSDTKGSASKTDSKSDMNKSANDTKPGAAQKGAASENNKMQNNAAGEKSSTTGQGAAAGQAKLSSEQQTKVTTAFKSDKSVKSVSKTEINVSISVGTRIPSHVHVYPVPTEVITVYPQWRGYDVILVDGQYIILEPRTREIVYIIT